MREEVRALIDGVWLQPGGDFDSSTVIDAGVRLQDAWIKKHEKWVRFSNFWGILVRALQVAVREKRPTSRQRLQDVLGPTGVEQLEHDLLADLERLPRRYLFYFPLTSALPLGAPEITLSKTLALVEAEQSDNALAGTTLRGLASVWAPPPPSVRKVPALRVHAVGYFDGSLDDSAAAAALAVLRQFIAMGLAAGLIQEVILHRPERSVSGDVTAVDLKEPEKKLLLKLPEPMTRFLDGCTIGTAAFGHRVSRDATPLVRAMLQQPRPEAERPDVLRKNFGIIERVLSAPNEEAKHLRAAAEWLFDSEAERNETTALLFAAIGLEAVLDSPTKETTDRLGDRLAWLLGRTRKQRTSISGSYKDFYRVRSELVHGRERTLDAIGRGKGRWAQSMLRAALGKDIEQWPEPEETGGENGQAKDA